MKQIFDWLREQIETECEKLHLKEPNGNEFDAIEVDEVLKLINEAEAKWEAECCEWEDTKKGIFHIKTNCGNWIETNYGYKFCPYCGKPIKISEVE